MSRTDLESSVKADLGPVGIPSELSVEIIGGSEGFFLFDGETLVAERRFDSVPSDCDAQVRMLSVVIAMAIEHHVVSAGAEPKATESSPGEPVVSAPPKHEIPQAKVDAALVQPTPEPREKPKRRQTRRIPEDRFASRVALGASYSYGLMPVAAPLWTTEAGLMFPGGWFIGAGFLSSERMRIAFEIPEEEGNGVSVPEEAFTKALGQLMAGTLVGCYEPAFEDGEIGFCAGMAAGRFHARGVEGFEPNPGQSVPWLAALGRVIGRAPARGPFGMSLSIDIFANFLRPGVELLGEGSAKSPRDAPPVGGAIGLGTFFVIK